MPVGNSSARVVETELFARSNVAPRKKSELMQSRVDTLNVAWNDLEIGVAGVVEKV